MNNCLLHKCDAVGQKHENIFIKKDHLSLIRLYIEYSM